MGRFDSMSRIAHAAAPPQQERMLSALQPAAINTWTMPQEVSLENKWLQNTPINHNFYPAHTSQYHYHPPNLSQTSDDGRAGPSIYATNNYMYTSIVLQPPPDSLFE